MADWHEIRFAVPRLATLSDLQLEALFYDRDGA